MTNDRFKFRAWDKENKSYIGCDYPSRWFDVDELYGDIEEIYLEGIDIIANDDDYVLEQCTGLKDKNGKLIYEGDILKYFGNKIVVVWDNESPSFKLNGVDGSQYGQLSQEYVDSFGFEVIGNIHENPELLKEVK